MTTPTGGFNLVNSLLFPTPESSYEFDSFPEEELIWLPRSLDPHMGKVEENVPCLFLTSSSARFLMLYLHSNAEDLGRCYHFCNMLRLQFQVHVLAVEYPGYGICPGSQASEETVISNARLGFRFATQVLRFPAEDIIVVGRSVGSGPALCLASEHTVYGVILICPFLSVKEVVRSHLGRLADLIDERFPNKDKVKKISGSLLIVHGKKDVVVPWIQGDALYEACPKRKKLVLPEDMSHNASLLSDPCSFVVPVLQFFGLPDYNFEQLSVPDWVYDPRMCPYFGKGLDEVSRHSKKIGEASNADGLAQLVKTRSKSVPGRRSEGLPLQMGRPGPRMDSHRVPLRQPPTSSFPSPEPDILDGVVQRRKESGATTDIADAAVHRFLAWQTLHETAQPKDHSSEDKDELLKDALSKDLVVNCSVIPTATGTQLQGEDKRRRSSEELPSPPDDAGFFKVPRSQNAGPTLTAPIKLPTNFDAAGSDRTCDWAPSWMPGLCSLAPRARGAVPQECITVTAQGSEMDQAVWKRWTAPAPTAGPRPSLAEAPVSTRRPLPTLSAFNDPVPEDPDPIPETPPGDEEPQRQVSTPRRLIF